MRTSEIKNQIDQLNAELESIRSMSEQEACLAWNVDAKQDIIDVIEDEISALEDDFEDAERECDYVHPDYVTDEEFFRTY